LGTKLSIDNTPETSGSGRSRSDDAAAAAAFAVRMSIVNGLVTGESIRS
jgi:hypothetical protein